MLNIFNQNSSDFIKGINEDNFDNIALQIFEYQSVNCPIYKEYISALGIDPISINSVSNIPFLPISFFKTHDVLSTHRDPELVFESSGTTGIETSKHLVADRDIYTSALIKGFEDNYGDTPNYTILALLPSYLERSNASLVHMVRVLMDRSGKENNGFFLSNHQVLADKLHLLKKNKEKVLLIGVTFALLDFAEAFPVDLSGIIVMETGGMKGRREEMTREQVHQILQTQFNLSVVHSEYGMTELLSQGYSKGNGLYYPSSTMKVCVRDMNDPLDVKTTGTGLLNIIDIANLYSCSFIATDDIGKVYPNKNFEVLGRADHSALRGCSLMTV